MRVNALPFIITAVMCRVKFSLVSDSTLSSRKYVEALVFLVLAVLFVVNLQSIHVQAPSPTLFLEPGDLTSAAQIVTQTGGVGGTPGPFSVTIVLTISGSDLVAEALADTANPNWSKRWLSV